MMIKSLEAVFCYIGYNNLIKVVGATPVPEEHSEFSLSKLVCLSPSLNNFFFHLNTSRPKKFTIFVYIINVEKEKSTLES